MEKLTAAVEWFKAHKAAIGATLFAVATVVGGIAVEYKNDDLLHIAGVITILATTLSGGGLMKSDQFYRERLNVIKTQLDRRNGDSLIPVNDLKKLVNKAAPDIFDAETGELPPFKKD